MLRDGHERDLETLERLHHPGEVQQRPAQTVHLVHDHRVDLAGFDVPQKACQSRTIRIGAGKSPVVISVRQTHPAGTLLTGNVGFGRFPLGVERIELLVQTFAGTLAGVDRAPHGRRRCSLRLFSHAMAPSLFRPKKWYPFQCLPVIRLVTAVKDL